jgi:hypothetical protein
MNSMGNSRSVTANDLAEKTVIAPDVKHIKEKLAEFDKIEAEIEEQEFKEKLAEHETKPLAKDFSLPEQKENPLKEEISESFMDRDRQNYLQPPEPETTLPPQSFDPDRDLQIGYMVGVQNDGQFFWRVFGTKKEFTGLLGVHQFASANIEAHKQNVLTTGDALTRELINLIAQLNQKIDFIAAKITAPKNQL